MVPLSERGHRLYGYEIPEVIEGLRLRLERLSEAEEDRGRAGIAFRTLYRLIHAGPGRLRYPQVRLGLLELFSGEL